MRSLVEKHLASRYARYTLNTAALAYIVVLALEYYPSAMKIAQPQLEMADMFLNGICLVELGLRLYVYRGDFFKKMFVINLPKRKTAQPAYPQPQEEV